MKERIATTLVSMFVDAAVARGLAREALIAAAGLTSEDLEQPTRLVDQEHFVALLRFVLERTGDPAFGLRAAEGTIDLRTQGFWGYALLSSTTLRERLEVHTKYQAMRGLVQFSIAEDGDAAVLELHRCSLPDDLAPVLLDWGVARSVRQLHRHTDRPDLPLAIWLSYPERPYHLALRRLVNGPIFFGAPAVRIQVPASVLDTRLPGDPHLRALAAAELDRQLAMQGSAFAPADVLEHVRRALAARLDGDASMPRIAEDLAISVRTLQRKLGARGASFQELLEDVRRTRALALLSTGDEPVERIAARVGYGDASNFRRAFRRWTGLSPTAYRESKARAPHARPALHAEAEAE